MKRRTTIEIDEDLLARAQRALGSSTTRATVEEALRRAAEGVEAEQAARAAGQRDYLEQISARIGAAVLASDEMWYWPAGFSTSVQQRNRRICGCGKS